MKRFALISILLSCTALMTTLGLLIPSVSGQMDNSIFVNPQRPVCRFDHDIHNENAGLEDCATCHHVYENKILVQGESSEDLLCSDCHTIKSSAGNSIPLRAAFHSRCQGCHFEVQKGPVLCGECHIKKEARP